MRTSIYGFTWRALPGPTLMKASMPRILMAMAVVILFTVFPAVATYLPFSRNTVHPSRVALQSRAAASHSITSHAGSDQSKLLKGFWHIHRTCIVREPDSEPGSIRLPSNRRREATDPSIFPWDEDVQHMGVGPSTARETSAHRSDRLRVWTWLSHPAEIGAG